MDQRFKKTGILGKHIQTTVCKLLHASQAKLRAYWVTVYTPARWNKTKLFARQIHCKQGSTSLHAGTKMCWNKNNWAGVRTAQTLTPALRSLWGLEQGQIGTCKITELSEFFCELPGKWFLKKKKVPLTCISHYQRESNPHIYTFNLYSLWPLWKCIFSSSGSCLALL